MRERESDIEERVYKRRKRGVAEQEENQGKRELKERCDRGKGGVKKE